MIKKQFQIFCIIISKILLNFLPTDIINIIILIKKLLINFLIELFLQLFLISAFFRVLCYTKLTFDWFAKFNPNMWPYSVITSIVNPYFSFFSSKIPMLRVEIGIFDPSMFLSLQIVNLITWICFQIVLQLRAFEN